MPHQSSLLAKIISNIVSNHGKLHNENCTCDFDIMKEFRGGTSTDYSYVSVISSTQGVK